MEKTKELYDLLVEKTIEQLKSETAPSEATLEAIKTITILVGWLPRS